ncbi:MAG: isoprenyl transferase [Gammaproteobacteria bacterium]|nr:isoprenyl transferase [Gammaproteobacteria bacterium]MDH3608831.1 isoprenyl transferase [Gammaproteobacteria bacterium]NNC69069.1 isoprenyl transferase [Gammaproteobacteria bacterium]
MSDEIIPNHVAIIMDGNGRWAKQRKLPRTAGHREGVKSTQEVIKASGEAGVKYLTLFAFSSENWNRPKTEVSALMDLFMRSLENEVQNLAENGVRLKFLGETSAFSKKLFKQIQKSEEITSKNEKLFLNIAVNYGGKWDILEAIKKLINAVQNGELSLVDINDEALESKLATQDMPAPDLFIRTGGEQRISNFLLWQLAYTELYFSEVLWPDFSPKELKKAFDSYSSRQRRFGRTQEQVTE